MGLLMGRAFCDLAVSFAEIDPDAADDAVRRIEMSEAPRLLLAGSLPAFTGVH